MRSILQSALLVITAGFNAAHAADPNCEPHLLTQAKLHIAADGTVLLPMEINDHEVYLDLRIGSGLPLIRESAIEMLGLKAKGRHGGSKITFQGRNVTHYVRLDNMKLGNFRFASRTAPVLSPTEEKTLPIVNGRPVVGIIGSTIFQMTDAELNLAESEIRLFRKFRCMGKSPVYWGGEVAELPLRFDLAGTLIFTLELEGKRIEAGLLMGGRESSIDASAAREFFGIDKKVDDNVNDVYFPMSLTGPGFQIKDAKVRLNPVGRCKLTSLTPGYGAIGYADCVNRVPFALGTDMLQQLRIYISAEREKVFVTTLTRKPGDGTGSFNIAPGR